MISDSSVYILLGHPKCIILDPPLPTAQTCTLEALCSILEMGYEALGLVACHVLQSSQPLVLSHIEKGL